MQRTPWMPLYCDDFISSCADMSCEELGAYTRLLCHIWSRGPIPIDESVICRIAGCKKTVWKTISNRFSPCTRDDGTSGLSQTRLEAERLKRHLRGEARSEAGKRGASARWQTHSKGNGKSMPCHNHNQNRDTNVNTTMTANEAAPAPLRAGLPRLSEVDPAIETGNRNREFLKRHRGTA